MTSSKFRYEQVYRESHDAGMGALYNVVTIHCGKKIGSSRNVGIRTYEVTEGPPPGVEDSSDKSH